MAVKPVLFAVSQTTVRGEDEQNPYLQGIEYNQTLALRAEQEKNGWRAAIGAAREASGDVRISVSLNQANGTPEARAFGCIQCPAGKVSARLRRGTSSAIPR
jgi:nitrogen fixation protein FixH